MKAPLLNDRPRPSTFFCWDNAAYRAIVADWCALHGLDPAEVPQRFIRWDDTTVEYRLFKRDAGGRKILSDDEEDYLTEWRTTPLLAPFPQPEEVL